MPDSWRTNLNQDATQVFSVVNRMHDWLMQPSIGFNEAAGNFQTVNFTGQGKGGDAVLGKASYGADTDNGLPAGRYQNDPPPPPGGGAGGSGGATHGARGHSRWAVRDSNARPPACKAGALTS